jgi:hypothetical protein
MTPTVLRFDDALRRMISVSYNWENNLSCPFELRLWLTAIF